MAAFAMAGTPRQQRTDAQPNWGVATFVGATTLALAAWPGIAAAKQPHVDTRPFAIWEQGNGTTVSGGLISDASRDLGHAMHMPHNSEAMSKFKELLFARPATDVGAIVQIHALATSSFTTATGGAPKIDCRVEDEPEGPAIFLTVDTHGMDFDEQMRREMAMRETIWADSRLLAAKNYVVLSVF